MHAKEVLRRPLMTEKTAVQVDYDNQYSFEVDRRANKLVIKDAVQSSFDVTVKKVRVINMPARIGRRGRRLVIKRPAWKKAIVTLADGDSITWVEGV
ncbi:MAG: 50S ribosomal protein L23 [Chloroflexota bacterium]|nr:50S ribosomal protein L23 [Chloroflexota bacterium]